jgi:hypothetical protein
MKTRPPDLVLLDDCDVEPGCGAVQRRRIPSGAAADDDDVELLGRGDHLLCAAAA